jgi:hypothetical protein
MIGIDFVPEPPKLAKAPIVQPIWKPQMPGQKADHLTRHLQVRHPTVEIDPIEALQIQTNMSVKDVAHGHNTGHHGPTPGSSQLNPASLASSHRSVTYQPSHHLDGPRRSLFSN